MSEERGCPLALGTGECDCADPKWIVGLLAKLASPAHLAVFDGMYCGEHGTIHHV